MSVIPNADPFHLAGGSVAILMVHGFTGSPVSVRPWAEGLHQRGFTVRVPLLPGHGRTWQEMNETAWPDWFEEIEKNLLDLQREHQRIFVAGFSMGGALSLKLAMKYREKIEGLLLVNPSVHDRRPIISLVPFLKYFVPSVGGRGTDVAAPNPPRHSYGRTPLKALASLRHLWRDVERNLHQIDQPLMIGYSIHDHVVDPSNSETVIDNVSSIDIREVIFENSFHNVALDHDIEFLIEESHAFIQDVLAGELGHVAVLDDELIDAEFEAIVSGLSLDQSSPTTFLDELEDIEAADRYRGDNSALPELTRIQRAALVGVIGGPLYIVAYRFFSIDLLGLDIWPGLLVFLLGLGAFFWQMKPDADDDDGAQI